MGMIVHLRSFRNCTLTYNRIGKGVEEQESLSYPTTDVLVIEGNAMVAGVEWSFGGWNLLQIAL